MSVSKDVLELKQKLAYRNGKNSEFYEKTIFAITVFNFNKEKKKVSK